MHREAQFIRVKWIEEKPYLLMNTEENELELLHLGSKVQIEKTNKRICTGYYDLELRKEYPCSSRIEMNGETGRQCADCEEKGGFSVCLRCNGKTCFATNKKAKDFCKQEHSVYLAYFNGIVKVGTTAAYRGTDRLLEQGALLSIFIAKAPNGEIARYIETLISEIGVATRVSNRKKMEEIISPKSKAEIKKILLNKFYEIKKYLPSNLLHFFIEPETNDFFDILDIPKKHLETMNYQIDIFSFSDQQELTYENYRISTSDERIDGDLVGVIGSVLIVNKDGSNICYNLGNLNGHILKIG